MRVALDFSDEDLDTIYATGTPDEMAAAGLWTRLGSERGHRCVVEAYRRAPQEPCVVAALAHRMMMVQREREFEKPLRDPQVQRGLEQSLPKDTLGSVVLKILTGPELRDFPETSIEDALDVLESIDTDNGASLALRAARRLSAAWPASLQDLQRAIRLPAWDNFTDRLRTAWMHAAMPRGYSQFAAYNAILGFIDLLAPRMITAERGLTASQLSEATPFLLAYADRSYPECRTMMDHLMVDACVRKCAGHDALVPVPAIEARLDAYAARTRTLISYLHTINTADFPEERWLVYFDTMYEQSEVDAIQAIYDERAGRPGTAVRSDR
jgi:hypothetical protein